MKTSALKAFLLSMLLFVGSVLLSTAVAVSSPVMDNITGLAQATPTASPFPEEPVRAASPESPPETVERPQPEGDRSAPESQPKTEPSPETAASEQAHSSSGPYDMKAIQEFYKSLYGS